MSPQNEHKFCETFSETFNCVQLYKLRSKKSPRKQELKYLN